MSRLSKKMYASQDFGYSPESEYGRVPNMPGLHMVL